MQDDLVTRANRVLELMGGDSLIVVGKDGTVSLFGPTPRTTDGQYLAKGVFEMMSDGDWRRRVIQRSREKFSTEPS